MIRNLLFAAVALLAGPALANGFKCPDSGKIIPLGSTEYEVRARCREPDDAATRTEVRTVKERVSQRVNGKLEQVEVEKSVEVVIDEWTYDFGSNRFLRFLRFENNRLVRVVDGEKGVKPPT